MIHDSDYDDREREKNQQDHDANHDYREKKAKENH